MGPITAPQARQLAQHAARDPAAAWRIIITSPGGQALAVAPIPRPRDGPGPRGSPRAGPGLAGRITLIISQDTLTSPPPIDPAIDPAGQEPASAIMAAALLAATTAAQRAAAQAQADAAAGGCAHQAQTPAYRPPPRLHEYIVARDLTCRFPTCRQPAWRGDLDHTIAYHRGGRTCRCNLGGLCRTHHQLKQLQGWTLSQTRPGTFQWTTPAGLTYHTQPDTHNS